MNLFDQSGFSELANLVASQNPGDVWFNPVKYLIRNALQSGVPIDTLTLLLLLPLVAALIAATRHLIGLRGFGIFLPAALSIVFVVTGPVVGIGLFLIIVAISTITRVALRNFKIKLQYLPRMAFLLWLVVLGVVSVLFSGPLLALRPEIAQVSIFPVIILILLAEDFARVQLGKSVKVAISLTIETIILGLISFAVLQLRPLQTFALLHPEALLLIVLVFDLFLGKYTGLRLIELWRFRKLIRS